MTVDVVEFQVVGDPVEKGSKSLVPTPAGPRLIDGKNARYRGRLTAWRGAIEREAQAAALRHHLDEPWDEAVEARLDFYLIKPASTPRWRSWVSVKPDLDKLARTVLDELSGVLIRDDARIVRLTVEKHYVLGGRAPGVLVVLKRLGAAERAAGDARVRLARMKERSA